MAKPRTAEHECVFLEIEILEDDENLKAGMKVLAPCERCGDTPLDHIGILDMYLRDATDAIDKLEPRRMLYHWSPRSRRRQILRYGLRPFMRSTTSDPGGVDGYKAAVVCFADSPSWAWALSGQMKWTAAGEWDCWQTSMDLLTDPIILPGPDRASGIYEVRTEHRVFKRDLWWVGCRTKGQAVG